VTYILRAAAASASEHIRMNDTNDTQTEIQQCIEAFIRDEQIEEAMEAFQHYLDHLYPPSPPYDQ